MENNFPSPDEMDRLLRETFLENNFPETEAVTDLMAKHAFTGSWTAVPPVGKATAFAAKKGFFAGFSLNAVWITLSVIGLALAGGLYYFNRETGKTTIPPAKKTAQILPETAAAGEPEPLPVSPEKKTTPEAREKHPFPPTGTRAETAAPPKTADSGAVYSIPPRGTSLPEGRAQKNPRYVLIPDITPEEAAANRRRKDDMLRQLLKIDKKEWAYAPSGRTQVGDATVEVPAFYMQTHEVSNLQYKTFLYDLVLENRLREYELAAVRDSGWMHYSGMESYIQNYFWNPAYNDYPVVNITPQGAQLYCVWLTQNANGLLGHKEKINDVHLPSVAEWLYAARAGNDSNVYAWPGQYLRNSRGVFLANSRSGSEEDYDGVDITAPVRAYAPNAWGFYNLCGNVAEMTLPIQNGSMQVKGGSWSRPPAHMRLTHDRSVPVDDFPLPDVGFRCVYTFLSVQER